MPSTRHRSGRPCGSLLPRFSFAAVVLASFAVDANADIDLTGRWRAAPGVYLQLAQSGTDVTVTSDSTSWMASFDQMHLIHPPDGMPAPVSYLQQYGDGAILDGWGRSGATFTHIRYTRCECYDGNESGGDGCDAECRIEPCFTCTPEPSSCLPSPDAAACDDRNDCTTGETCAAGVCGSGSTVTPCVNLTGEWRLNREYPSTGAREQLDTVYTQRDGVVFNSAEIGEVDTASGAFHLLRPGGISCTVSISVTGSASLDNLEFSAEGTRYTTPSFTCIGTPLTIEAHRCDETGCDLSDCTGHADGTPCESGPCRVNELCQSGSCNGDLKCPACQSCDGVDGFCDRVPRPGCHKTTDSQSSSFQVIDKGDEEKDQIRWSWKRGESFDAEALDPAGPDDLTLCVFPNDDDQDLTLYQTTLESDTPCAKSPCWKGADGSYKYRNDAASSDVVSLVIREGEAGKSRIQLKAKGSKIDEFAFLETWPAPIVTQLQSTTGECFEAEFRSSGFSSNEGGMLKAKGGTFE
jgi:cysteine-rich repeat protein